MFCINCIIIGVLGFIYEKKPSRKNRVRFSHNKRLSVIWVYFCKLYQINPICSARSPGNHGECQRRIRQKALVPLIWCITMLTLSKNNNHVDLVLCHLKVTYKKYVSRGSESVFRHFCSTC